MTSAEIATLRICPRCKGSGQLPATISLDGSFTPGIVCPRCKGERVLVVGGCCGGEHERPYRSVEREPEPP